MSRILEHAGSGNETDPVFVKVAVVLGWIPLELHRSTIFTYYCSAVESQALPKINLDLIQLQNATTANHAGQATIRSADRHTVTGSRRHSWKNAQGRHYPNPAKKHMPGLKDDSALVESIVTWPIFNRLYYVALRTHQQWIS